MFGAPLHQALKHSSVAISLVTDDGEPYVWGYIPAVVAKIGYFLKQHATETEGIFRVNGSEKRVRDLCTLFDTPPTYGRTLDWSPYTVHDAASVLRRFLNNMPQPVIPHSMYRKFCRAMTRRDPDTDEIIHRFRALIVSLPQANQYLLLYLLDLLAVFDRKSDRNLMKASNLAIVFQPGIINVPSMRGKDDHHTAVHILEFLITYQDSFVLALSKPPPTDVAPEELTHRPPPDVHDYMLVPSDSDEDLGEMEVHLGGGAHLGSRPQTSSFFGSKRERGSNTTSPSITRGELPEEQRSQSSAETRPELPSWLNLPRVMRRRSNSLTQASGLPEPQVAQNSLDHPKFMLNKPLPSPTLSSPIPDMGDKPVAVPVRPPLKSRSVSSSSVIDVSSKPSVRAVGSAAKAPESSTTVHPAGGVASFLLGLSFSPGSAGSSQKPAQATNSPRPTEAAPDDQTVVSSTSAQPPPYVSPRVKPNPIPAALPSLASLGPVVSLPPLERSRSDMDALMAPRILPQEALQHMSHSACTDPTLAGQLRPAPPMVVGIERTASQPSPSDEGAVAAPSASAASTSEGLSLKKDSHTDLSTTAALPNPTLHVAVVTHTISGRAIPSNVIDE